MSLEPHIITCDHNNVILVTLFYSRCRLYSGFRLFNWRSAYQLLSMLKIKRDINQQDLKIFNLHVVQSDYFSLTWSCGSRQQYTTSSGWKFQLNNFAVIRLKRRICDITKWHIRLFFTRVIIGRYNILIPGCRYCNRILWRGWSTIYIVYISNCLTMYGLIK